MPGNFLSGAVSGWGMKVLKWLVLAISTIAGACDSETNPQTRGIVEPERAPFVGAGPGGFLPSTCMGQDDLRAWRRAVPRDAPLDVGARETWPGSHCNWSVVMHGGVPVVSADHPKTVALPIPKKKPGGV